MTTYTTTQMTTIFEHADAEVRSFDLAAFEGATAVAVKESRAERFARIYKAVRPIILLLQVTPLIPSTWRDVLRAFVVTLDELAPAIASDPDFKAGKDL